MPRNNRLCCQATLFPLRSGLSSSAPSLLYLKSSAGALIPLLPPQAQKRTRLGHHRTTSPLPPKFPVPQSRILRLAAIPPSPPLPQNRQQRMFLASRPPRPPPLPYTRRRSPP